MLRMFGWLAISMAGAIWWGHLPSQNNELAEVEHRPQRSEILDRSAVSVAQLPIIQASFAAPAPAPAVAKPIVKTSSHTQEQPTVPFDKVTWSTGTNSELETVVSNDAPAGYTTSADPAPSDGMVSITGNRVNLRAGPSTGDAVVGQLTKNMRVEVLSAPSNGWIQLHHADTGLTGYMAARFTSYGG